MFGRGRFVLISLQKPYCTTFSLPLRSALPLKTLPLWTKAAPASAAALGWTAGEESSLKPHGEIKKTLWFLPKGSFPGTVSSVLLLTATLSFLDTMFLLTPENFPLECAINQQQRQQQLWRRSSEKGHSFFHLLEEKKRGGRKAKLGAAAHRAELRARPGSPHRRGFAPEGCERPRRARGRSELLASPWKKMWKMPRIGARVCVCARVCARPAAERWLRQLSASSGGEGERSGAGSSRLLQLRPRPRSGTNSAGNNFSPLPRPLARLPRHLRRRRPPWPTPAGTGPPPRRTKRRRRGVRARGPSYLRAAAPLRAPPARRAPTAKLRPPPPGRPGYLWPRAYF